MRLFLSLVCLVFLTISCTKDQPKVGCIIQDAIVNTTTIAVATGLQCSNQDAIKASLNEAADKIKICERPAPTPGLTTMSLGSDLCTQLSTALINNLVSGVIPAAWGCTAAAGKEKLLEVVLKACQKI